MPYPNSPDKDPAPIRSSLLRNLQQVRSRVRNGDFRADLLEKVEASIEKWKSLRHNSPLSYYKALSAAAEVYDHFGSFQKAQKLLAEDGILIIKDMPSWKVPRRDEERALQKQKLWLALHFSRTQYYRDHEYDKAKSTIQLCQRTLERVLCGKNRTYPGTCARVSYLLGQVHRQLGEYDEALNAFSEAIQYAHQNLEEKRRLLSNESGFKERYTQELALMSRSNALCFGLGMGWVHYVRGRLNQAIPWISAARALLAPTNDSLHKAYLDLLLGCTYRAMAGSDIKLRQKAISILHKAYKAFHKDNHTAYRARAAYELSLAYLYRDDLNKAQTYADEVLKTSEQTRDVRWHSNALFIQSRILRKQQRWDLAVEVASKALAKAEESPQVQIAARVDALISRGEAYVDLKRYDEARTDFHRALKEDEKNPKNRGACILHIADTYIGEDNAISAEEQLKAWEKIADQVENQLLHEHASSVRRAIIGLSKDFTIPATEQNLNYERHHKLLKIFLARQATRRSKTIDEASSKVGVTRQSIHRWLNLS